MVQTLISIAHVFLAVALVAIVLLQRGKGAEAGTAFGAGASGTVFGARGSSSFLTRSTAVLATLFFVTSLSLAFLARQRPPPSSVLDSVVLDEPASDEGTNLLPLELEDGELPALPTEAPAEEDLPESE